MGSEKRDGSVESKFVLSNDRLVSERRNTQRRQWISQYGFLLGNVGQYGGGRAGVVAFDIIPHREPSNLQVLTPGTRLGPYDIQALIGQGGMGEVYRAHDSRLRRDVALKVLPSTFAADADRLARFEREAQTLAVLNHPHIAAIHGIEESNGTRALVMELVDGPTLADRIAQGAIPLADALPIARQIAEALEAAHVAGIVHRDLKPANIKLRPNGVVKVPTSGLAQHPVLRNDPRSAGLRIPGNCSSAWVARTSTRDRASRPQGTE